MVPVGETSGGQMSWGCTNPWHPRDPGPCPKCGNHGHHARTSGLSATPEARCRICGHEWVPFVWFGIGARPRCAHAL